MVAYIGHVLRYRAHFSPAGHKSVFLLIEPERAQAQGPNPGPRPQEPGPRHPWPGPKPRVMAKKGVVPSSMVYGGLMVNRACSLPPDFMEVCHHQILG